MHHDVSRTNIIHFQKELILQLRIRDITDFTQYVDEPEVHRARRWTTFITLQFSVLLPLVTGRCRSFVTNFADLPTYLVTGQQDTILNRIRTAYLPTTFNDQLHLHITHFPACVSARPSDMLTNLRELPVDHRYNNNQLRAIFKRALPAETRLRLVLQPAPTLDSYAEAADLLYDHCRELETTTSTPNSVNAIHTKHSSSSRRQATSKNNNGVCYTCWEDCWATDQPDHISNCPNAKRDKPPGFWKSLRANRALIDISARKRKASLITAGPSAY